LAFGEKADIPGQRGSPVPFLRSGSKAENPQFGADLADFHQLIADFLCSSDLLAEVAVRRELLFPCKQGILQGI
jgi:hypothetical protein